MNINEEKLVKKTQTVNTSQRNIIIPARLQSTRLPRKVLLEHNGQSLIMHVIKQAQKVKDARVIVATEDLEIVSHLRHVPNIEVHLTPSFENGTQRSFYLCQKLSLQGSLISWQADEPCLKPSWIETLSDLCIKDSCIATLVTENNSLDEFLSPNCVKVVSDRNNKALYFSRAPIPAHKGGDFSQSLPFMQHIGLYAFDCSLIEQIKDLHFCDKTLSQKEDLEQLQWLYLGFNINLHQVKAHDIIGIDTLEDWNRYCLLEDQDELISS